MLLGGDEMGRTQRGNNNAWCQDNELSWFDWEQCDQELLEFTRRLIGMRQAHPVFRRTQFFEGKGEQLPDVWWMRPDGRRMTRRDWENTEARAIGVFLNGDELDAETTHGEEVRDDSFLLLFNAHFERHHLPPARAALRRALGAGALDGPVEGERLVAGRRGDGSRRARSRSSAGREDLRATYRLQLTPEFGFAAARELVPYLRELGVSHLYLSPSLEARAGSQHGYDVIDPRRVSEALGGEEELRRLAGAGLGVILDIVPNHMAAVDENPFWRDLGCGRCSSTSTCAPGFHRRFFDVGELGGVKQEDWEVFWATHAKVIELVRDGVVDGVRVDHPDGLANPAQYFERLARGRHRARLGREDPRARRGAARLAGRRDDGVRVPERGARHLREPRRRGAADRDIRVVHR